MAFLFLATPTRLFAADRYMSPNGAGAQTGLDWANAYPASMMSNVLNAVMAPGDTLHLASGTYNTAITLTTSGTPGSPKRIVGHDQGGGLPLFDRGSWSRADPDAGPWSVVNIEASSSHWTIEGIRIRDCRHAILATAAATPHAGITIRNVHIESVRYGFYLRDCDDLTIEDCSVIRYTKHGYRLEQGCNNVTFDGCIADLSGGDSSWWDYSEPIPMGFLANSGGAANTNVTFLDCVANNHLRNGQSQGSYWNGDGFVAENNTSGLTFIGCIAINNEDAGFDLKQASGSTITMQDCVAVQNSSNFRFWYQNVSLSNCVATYPRKRGLGISSNSILSIWLQNATVNADRFTAHGDVGTSVKEVGTGSATLTNSILSYTGSDGSFTQGAVALGTGTVTYRPGAGVDPDYVNPSASWNGVGDDMNSQTYGTTKGYHRSAGGGSMVTIDAEADTYVWDNNPSSNYGTQSTLFVKDGSSGWDRVSYIRFPVSSLDGAASSVTLKLKVMVVGGEGAGDRPIEVRQLANDSWSETGTTWNNRPSTTGTLIATIPDAGMVGQTYEVDVTSYVNTQSTGDGTASFVLIQSTGTNRLVEFGSRENTGNKPTLEAVVPAAEIEADADTYVWDSSPPTNYGTQSTLLVKDGPSSLDRVSYIRFPVSSIGGSASSVVLKLKVVNIGGEGSGDRPIEVRQLVNDSWSETETTWNNRPSTTGTLIATIPDAGTVGQTYSVNVTNYINAQSIGDGAASFVLIQPAGTNRMVGLGSRENAANKPVLISE